MTKLVSVSKLSLFLAIIVTALSVSCKQYQPPIGKQNLLADKYSSAWTYIVIDLRGQKIVLDLLDSSVQLREFNYIDSVENNTKVSIGRVANTESAKLKAAEMDSIYVWTNKLITEFNIPSLTCSDFAGYIKLTIAYGNEVNQSCEYKSICDWKILAPETIKLNRFLKSKFPEFQ